MLMYSVHNNGVYGQSHNEGVGCPVMAGGRRQGRNQQASYSYYNGLGKRKWLGYKSKSGQALNGA